MKRFCAPFGLRLTATALLSATLLCAGVARADYEADAKVIGQVRAVFSSKDGTPAEHLTKAQSIAAGVSDNPTLSVSLAREIANFQRNNLSDNKGALATLEAALAKFPDAPERSHLVGYKVDVLSQDDPDAAVAYGKTQWPLVQKTDPANWFWFVTPYAAALKASGNDAEALALLQGVWRANLINAGNYKGNWVAPLLAKSLLDAGQSAEALSVAKLGWMLCAFDTDSINDATKTLLTTWAQSDTGGKSSEAFVKAQSDASAPNPLKDVPLPTIAPDVLKDQLARADSGASETRISVLLAGGQLRKAMLLARAMMTDRPDSPEGVSQVCRVFKAADLNLVRANGFVAWVKKPDGPNPILAFLQEHPASGDAAPTPTPTS